MKCQIGQTDIFINSGSNKVSCSGVDNPGRTYTAMVFDPSLRFLNPIDNGIGNRSDQLVLRNDVYKGSSIPDNMTGYIFLNFGSTWPASMRSCFVAPCSSSDNVLTATINYQWNKKASHMKKLLGIVVLGLMLSGNAYADRLGIGEKR